MRDQRGDSGPPRQVARPQGSSAVLQLIPYAVALIHAPRTRTTEVKLKYLSLTSEDADTLVFRPISGGAVMSTSSFHTFSLRQLIAMEETHDTVADFASRLSGEAWAAISNTLNDMTSMNLMPNHLDLSPKEWLRFCRCLYRVELYYGLMTTRSLGELRDGYMTWGNVSLDPVIQFANECKARPGERMVADLAIWEVEQIAATLQYLSGQFIAAAKGALAADSLIHRCLSPDRWLCKGLKFLQNLEKMSNFEKTDLLDSVPKLDASLQEPNLADIDADDGPRKGLDSISPRAVMENG
ncbi:hypothetical protein Landi51_04045 [Colletotrichum acutatum]